MLDAFLLGGEGGKQLDRHAELGVGRGQLGGASIEALGGTVGTQAGPAVAQPGAHRVEIAGALVYGAPGGGHRRRRRGAHRAAGELPVQRARIVHLTARSRAANACSTSP